MLLKICEKNFYKIIDTITNSIDKEKIINAYNIAKKAHEGQKRKSGEAYITHPLAVGLSLWRRFRDVDLFISGLLHDTVEDCNSIDMKYIYGKFGGNIGFIVDSITKTKNTFFEDDYVFEDERDKMLYGGMKNIGCILVKMADREHNLATLSYMPKDKQVKKSFESQSLYIPLMHILGFNKVTKNSIIESGKYFNKYLIENNLKTYKQLKRKLLNTCFYDFTEELFDIAYNNSTSIVWELEDKIFFDELLESGWFDDEAVEIKNIVGTSIGGFKVTFVYKKGMIFKNMSGKINISKNIFIS